MRPANARTLHVALAVAAVLGGCGEEQLEGIGQPFFVNQSTFHPGALPGLPPGTVGGEGPAVTSVEYVSEIFRANEAHRAIDGHVSPDGNAIAVQLVGADGYWLEPVLSADPTVQNDLTFALDVGFGDVEPGPQTLLFVAIDPDGVAGTQVEVPICIGRPFNDNLNVCIPTIAPPATVVSLRIGNDADLDLVLVGPDDEVVDPDQPIGDGPGPVLPGDVADPTLPRIDRDSNANCFSDGSLRETAIFRENPTGQSWKVFVNPTDSCGFAATTFEIELYRRVDNGDGTYGLALESTFTGQLLAAQANGGVGTPLYVTTLEFP